MASLLRQASKLLKHNSSAYESDDSEDRSSVNSSDFGGTSVAKKSLFSSLAKGSLNNESSEDRVSQKAGLFGRKESQKKERSKDYNENDDNTTENALADASSALASARRVRSEHALNEDEIPTQSAPPVPNNLSQKPQTYVDGMLKKTILHRSHTSGQKVHHFNTLDPKDAPFEQGFKLKPSTLQVAKDGEAYTGRTSVTMLNKSNPSSSRHNRESSSSSNSVQKSTLLRASDAPPIPSIETANSESVFPKLTNPIIVTKPGLSPVASPLSKARAHTDQPVPYHSNFGTTSKSSANLNMHMGVNADTKYKQQLQQASALLSPHADSQAQLLQAENGVNLLQNSAAAQRLRQDKRNAGLSAYEINTPQASSMVSASAHFRRYSLDDFHIVRRVGRGGFAIVFLVRQKTSSGRYYALKAIRKAEVVKLKQEKQIVNEKEILKSIKHNFIVELFHAFQDVHYLYTIMEYIDGGDLYSYLRKVQKFGEEDSKFYSAEVLMALQYLHSENIVFRDLKPENILLDMTGHIKLADFGFAKIVPGTTKSFCGTPDYIAREIVKDVLNRPYTKMVDWWSFGVLVFELVSGKTPFQSETPDGIYDNIEQCKIGWNPLIKGNCKDLVSRLLEKAPDKRIGSQGDGQEIRGHPWFKTVNWAKAEIRQMQPPFLPACETPDVIERERAAKGHAEDYASMLKSGVGGGASATDKRPDLSWLTNATADPFKNF
ncbi:camp-dependent protein kinase catalytic subunit [Entophlyctis sp. JEL0112]|nr:camp-dependent protein kinase catalytic subunit [Entophlyctis sp. JEL0112]